MAKDRSSNSNNDESTSNGQASGNRDRSQEPKRRKGIQPRRQTARAELPSRTKSQPESLETSVSDIASKRFEYSSRILDDVQAVTAEQPYSAFKRVTPVVNVSSLFDYLTESTFRFVELRTLRAEPLFSLEELRYTYRYILALRLAHVSGQKLPEGVRPAEVRYPAILGPLLASIGKYVHPTAAYEIVPSIDPRMQHWAGLVQVTEKGPNLYRDEKTKVEVYWNWAVEKGDVFDRVLSVLLALGSPISIGLPVDVVIEGDELYRLDDTSDQKLTGSGDFAPSAGTILNRAFIQLSTLAELYGEHRTVYAALATLRSAVDKLARDSFNMEVGSNGVR